MPFHLLQHFTIIGVMLLRFQYRLTMTFDRSIYRAIFKQLIGCSNNTRHSAHHNIRAYLNMFVLYFAYFAVLCLLPRHPRRYSVRIISYTTHKQVHMHMWVQNGIFCDTVAFLLALWLFYRAIQWRIKSLKCTLWESEELCCYWD